MIKIIYYLRWICFLGILTGCMISAFSHQESHQSIFWFSTLIYGFSNLTLYYLASKIKTSSNNQKIILSAIIFDSLFLFILITQLGGSHNPFAILYIFIACVSASSLNRNNYLASIILILILLGVIYSGWFDHHHHQPANLKTHLQGMWIANSLAVLIGSLWIYYLRKHNQTLEIKNLQNQKIIFDLEKMDSLGKMMATTSHKINTSLGTIKLGLGELSDPLMMNNQKEYKEWINHCKTALTQIEEVIGKMQSHQKESFINNEQQVNIVDFLKLSTTHWAKPRKVELEINSFSDKIFTNLGIAEEIRDIVFLLFDNSYQAYDHVVSPKIIFSVEKNSQNFTLIIEDFGTGMEEEIKNKVFEPLFTTKPQGTGIGLYSCYQTVKKLNGKIDIESKVNIGTKVTIIIPMKNIR